MPAQRFVQLAFLAFASVAVLTGGAETRAANALPPGSKKQPAGPDLRCSISAWKDKARTKPIANGATVDVGDVEWVGSSGIVTVEMIITNAGTDTAALSAHSASILRDGTSVKTFDETHTIPPGLSRIFPAIAVEVKAQAGNEMKIVVKADTGGAVAEASELNNVCELSLKVPFIFG